MVVMCDAMTANDPAAPPQRNTPGSRASDKRAPGTNLDDHICFNALPTEKNSSKVKNVGSPGVNQLYRHTDDKLDENVENNMENAERMPM